MSRSIFFVLEINAQNLHFSQDSIKNLLEIDLKEDLTKYNGFYSSIELRDGIITVEKIPERIKNIKNRPITKAPIQYLRGIENGYLLTFKVQFDEYSVLVISTLNKDYLMKDYRTYTDGTGTDIVKNDTIAMTTFGNDYVFATILLVVILFSAFQLYESYKDEPKFKLSVLGIEYKNTMYTWAEMTDLYIKGQHNGDAYNYDIIIQTKYWKETIISIGGLDSNIDKIKSDLAMFYWNWKISQVENT